LGQLHVLFDFVGGYHGDRIVDSRVTASPATRDWWKECGGR